MRFDVATRPHAHNHRTDGLVLYNGARSSGVTRGFGAWGRTNEVRPQSRDVGITPTFRHVRMGARGSWAPNGYMIVHS